MQNVNNKIIEKEELLLLGEFNHRASSAFGVMYEKLFDTMYHFARKIFTGTTIVPEDIIHDIFLSIWENKSLKFETIDHLKGYLYLSIRNYIKNYAIKQSRKKRYENTIIHDDEFISAQIIETEAIYEIHHAIDLLPNECAKVLRLFIDGLDAKDIAEQLGKSQSTIYNQRKMAIEILRKKLSNKSFVILLHLLS